MLAKSRFDNSFARLGEAFFTSVVPRPLSQPQMVAFDPVVAERLQLDSHALHSDAALDILSGKATPDGAEPLAMVYAGHQFGGYSPQLGDGRGLLLGEYQTEDGRLDLHLKGAGLTPYSRFGDGYAVLRSCIREFLGGIALEGLGIPTTGALAVVRGNDPVQRETVEPAATLLRVARTHVRFGSFEYFFYTDQPEQLRQLADYVLQQYLTPADGPRPGYEEILRYATRRTAELIAQWQAVGFCHGVMNTDNMSILGETLDFGPYGFMETYNPGHICNHSDHSGRYAYDQQPGVGLWNLNALAAALSPLIDEDSARDILAGYEGLINREYHRLLYSKLGLGDTEEQDHALLTDMFRLLQECSVDYTLFFRHLSQLTHPQWRNQVLALATGPTRELDNWLSLYQARLQRQAHSPERTEKAMLAANPAYILRNYYAQNAIERAYQHNDYSEVERLAKALRQPFTPRPDLDDYQRFPPPEGADIIVSCSS